MARRNTGDTKEYSDADAAAVEAEIDQAWADYEAELWAAEDMPSSMRVSARIEWAGVEDRARGGHRTTRLDGLELREVKQQLDRARTATPAKRRRAKGWHAQLRELTGTDRGHAASERAGLTASSRTVRGWLAEDHAPSRANQAKIADAYNELRMWRVNEARRGVADRLSASLRQRYGAEIRLRNITRMDLEP